MNDESKSLINLSELLERYKRLKPGPQADLRRAVEPDDLLMVPAFYSLTNGSQSIGYRRLIYFLPHLTSLTDEEIWPGKSLAEKDADKAADKKLTSIGTRLIQIDRYKSPDDLIQFRRLIRHLEPRFNWERLAKTILGWSGEKNLKRRMIEDYFRFKYSAKNKK